MRKIKIQLAITIGITVILLMTSFFLIRTKANDYLSMLDEMKGADWEEVEYGGLAFIATIILMIGSIIKVFALPLLVTAVILLPFLIIVLIAKKEKTQKVVTLILMILSIVITIFMLLYVSGMTLLLVQFAEGTTTLALSYALEILFCLTAVSLVSNLITVIVSYIKVTKYIKESTNQPIYING
ncbi:MAG: hypothetical protein J1G02_00385 [Clostridiales bacterium]|nr:hypothetical protein [Clostridiales bacterium]